MVVPELAAHLGQLVAVQADLTVLTAGVIYVQDPLRVTDAASTFSTAFGVEGVAMKEGTAEDVAEVGELGEETVQFWAQLWHRYGWSLSRMCQ